MKLRCGIHLLSSLLDIYKHILYYLLSRLYWIMFRIPVSKLVKVLVSIIKIDIFCFKWVFIEHWISTKFICLVLGGQKIYLKHILLYWHKLPLILYHATKHYPFRWMQHLVSIVETQNLVLLCFICQIF